MIVAGLAVNLPRVAAIAAVLLGALFAAGMLVTELPQTLTKPTDWGGWQAVTWQLLLWGLLALVVVATGYRRSVTSQTPPRQA